jgi:uncharacterized membrane protein
MKILYLGHVLGTIVWVGGMFFAHQCLRPVALAELEGPQRLRLWRGVFGRFFPWVWVSVVVLLATGHGLVGYLGGFAGVPVHVHVMVGIGYLMAAIFAFIYFVPYRRLRQAVETGDWAAGARAQDLIRRLVGTNLLLGLVAVVEVFAVPLVA